MRAYIYTTDSDKNRLNKNINLVKEVNINLLGDTDLLNPYFEIANVDVSILTSANYVYIEDFKRYYFIEKIEMLTGGNVALYCSIDVLMSHRDSILELSGTVKRAESLKNGYIVDENYKALAYSKIVTKKFPNAMTNDCFVLMTVG